MNRLLTLSPLFKPVCSQTTTASSKLLDAPVCIPTCLFAQQNRPKCRAGRYRPTKDRSRPLTYEMSNKPMHIGVRKGFNSWNTSSLVGAEFTAGDIAMEDMFIRAFLTGTWHRAFLSEVIIKRRANLIIINGICSQALLPRKYYWLIGYTEELLALLLKCPIKVDIHTAPSMKSLIYKYI